MMWLKRLLRPLIPDRLMARYRLHQHSRQVRTQVDLIVHERSRAKRWLGVLPDTYRVVVSQLASSRPDASVSPGPDGPVLVGDEEDSAIAAAALLSREVDAAVVGATPGPRLVGRRRVEPVIAPSAIAVRSHVLRDVGGLAPGDDLGALLHRLRDAGHRLAIVPRVTAAEIDATRHDPIDRPVAAVLAAVPMHDVGGGSRGAQLALELVAQGFHVVYVALFGTAESVDLGTRFVHPHLEQYRAADFAADALVSRAERSGFVLVEIPAEAHLPSIETLASAGWPVCYDVIDRWADPALGGEWYRADVERTIVQKADVVVASAPDLATEPGTVLVPNGVNASLFSGEPGPEPDDLPKGTGPLIGYHGSLYGDWFDWEAVGRVARAYPDGDVALIGDVPRATPALPANVHLLGLKPQSALLDYVARFDVGMLPFQVTETTHAVSPLKVFEYLACGVPVAAVPLRALDGLEVHTAPDLLDAVDAALAADRPDRASSLSEHTWERRVETMLATVGVEAPGGGSPVRIEHRPVVHYSRSQRLVE